MVKQTIVCFCGEHADWRGWISVLGTSSCCNCDGVSVVWSTLQRAHVLTWGKSNECVNFFSMPSRTKSPSLSQSESTQSVPKTFDVCDDFCGERRSLFMLLLWSHQHLAWPIKKELGGVGVRACTLSSLRLTERTDVEHRVVQRLDRCVMLNWSPSSCRAVSCTT